MIKLEGLASFVAIADAGSIGGAARNLGLSTSVVSERLAALERAVGIALVHRTTRKLTLTEDGVSFRARAAGILRDVEAASADFAERRGGLAGRLRLAAPLSFGRLHFGPALYPFLLTHPRIELVLDLDDRYVDAAGDGYDAAIRIGQVADNRLVAHRIAPSRRVLVASSTYLERNGRPRSVEDLRDHRAVSYTNRGVEDWRFKKGDGFVVARGTFAMTVNNGEVMCAAAEAGLGLALLPTFLVSEAVCAGRLQIVDVGLEAETDTVHVVHPRTRGLVGKVGALVSHLRVSFGSPPYWDRHMKARSETSG